MNKDMRVNYYLPGPLLADPVDILKGGQAYKLKERLRKSGEINKQKSGKEFTIAKEMYLIVPSTVDSKRE